MQGGAEGRFFFVWNFLDYMTESIRILRNPKGLPLLAGRFRSEGKVHLYKVATRGLKL
jgi:hypothetical protein